MMKFVIGLSLALTLCAGCSSDSDGGSEKPQACAPGKTEACACIGGVTGGVQTCNDTGAAWGKCECPGESTTGNAGASGMPTPQCTPGDSVICQCDTKCVGRSGMKSCDTQGNWSACVGDDCSNLPPQCQ